MGIKRRSPGKWTAHDITGVGAGWKLHTYIPGTTDNKVTHTNKDGSVDNTNPVIFDAFGEADIFWNGEYDLKLTDENDVQKWTLSDFGAGEDTINYGNFNKVKDGGFEDDTDGDTLPDQWTTTAYPTAGSGAGVAVLDTSDQIEGAKSLKFTSVGDGGGYALSSFFEVTEGSSIVVEWQTKSSTAGVRNLVEIVWYPAAQVLVSASSIFDDSTTNPTAWTKKTGSATAPSTARYAKLRMYGCHSSDATSGSTWFDDVVCFSQTYTYPGITDNYASLRLLSSGESSGSVLVKGYATDGDGGEGNFYWDSTSTATDNDGTIIKVTAITTGRWIRLNSEVLNVRWFGATGDGSTDDTDAILAAIAAIPATNGALLFPPATYIVNSDNTNGLKFTGLSNFRVSGYGAIVKVADAETVSANLETMYFTSCSDGQIEGLTIDGNRANRTIPGETSAFNLSINTSCSKLTFRDVMSKNSVSDGIILITTNLTTQSTYPTDIILEDCRTDNCYRNGLSVIASLRLRVVGGSYSNTTGASPQCGIDLEPDAGYTYGNRDLTIENVELHGNAGYGLAFAGPINQSNGFTVQNIRGSNNTLGFINVDTTENIVLRGIYCGDHSAATRGIIDLGANAKNVEITGVEFVNVTASNAANYLIYVHASISSVVKIADIVVRNSACKVIYAGAPTIIDNVDVDVTTAEPAITLTGDRSVCRNTSFKTVSGRAIYADGDDVVIENFTGIDCGVASGNNIQTAGARVVVRDISIYRVTSIPSGMVGIFFGAVPRVVNNVLARSEGTDFTSSNVVNFSVGIAGSSIWGITPDPLYATWVPVMKDNTTTITTSLVYANFTRVGRLIHARCQITRNDATGYTGTLTMEGLPYPQAVNTNPAICGGALFDNTSTDIQSSAYINGAVVTFYDTTVTGATPITTDLFANGRDILFSATYLALA